MASKPIMQFYAELKDAPFPVWRRFQTINDVRFSRLAYILMTMFEMQASHLFRIEIDNVENIRRTRTDELCDYLIKVYEEGGRYKTYLEVNLELMDDFARFGEESLDAAETLVKHHLTKPGYACTLEYDFGDGWEVEVTLEEVFEDGALPGRELPRVIAGEGYGIIEDCGGTWGLNEIEKAFQKGSGEAYENYSYWLGTDKPDLHAFDIEDMNFRLKKVPRIYKDIYELELKPTELSIAILERQYKK